MERKKIKNLFENIGLYIELNEINLKLPIAFTKRYDISFISNNNNSLNLMLIKEKRRGTIESFIKQAEKISEISGVNYVLTFSKIDSETRTLLIKARIPFLDYKGNMFIPSMGLILNKTIPVFSNQKFSPSEQLIMIYLLLGNYNNINPKSISERLKVSVPTVYRTLSEFTSRGWLLSKHGKYSLQDSPLKIYQKSFKYMINPVKKVIYVNPQYINDIYKMNSVPKSPKKAGLSALSEVSELSHTSPVYAVFIKDFEREYRKDIFFEEKIGENVEIQLFKYDPLVINGNIDPISLYLSLMSMTDPRVEIELEKLQNNIEKELKQKDAD